MFAQIIPLVRMPRRFAFFDYKIPENLDVQVGDLVTMPLKGRDVFGIIRAITDSSDFKRLSTIKSIRSKQLMSAEDVQRLELIANQIVQSPSTVFTSALQGLTHSRSTEQKIPKQHSGSIDKESAQAIREAIVEQADSIETSLEGSIAAIRLIVQKSKHQTLVICPRERDVEIISRFIPKAHARLHGHTPIAKRRWTLESWRSGDIKVLIGTRQASLLPADRIDQIVVFDPHSEDHVSYSRNPRFDARLAADLLAKQHKAYLTKCGPIAELLDDQVDTTPKTEINLINLKDKRQNTGIPLVSEMLLDAIAESLQNRKNVLISYNCKGVAKRLQCKSCHHIPMCGTCGSQPQVRLGDLVCPVCKTEMWIPKNCPSCGKQTLTSRGIGNNRIASELKQKFPQAKIELIDKEHSKRSDADIQIVTEHYFQSVYLPFPKVRFELIAELMAEKSLGSDFESSVTTAHRLNRLAHMAHHHKARLIVQTWMPDIINPMLDSKGFRESESQLREQYKLPPFTDSFELTSNLPTSQGGIEGGCRVITSEIQDRNKQIKKLQELPDSVTILTKYANYENPSNS